MRDQPVINKKGPFPVELEKGKDYYWCACGHSKRLPFCDASHHATDMTPVAFVAERDGTAYLCGCKHSKNPPYCDGSHSQL
ncbi:MAG: CDGSH iron-sulfur domain-containing protein [Candidatus Sedimenticola endophacoides]